MESTKTKQWQFYLGSWFCLSDKSVLESEVRREKNEREREKKTNSLAFALILMYPQCNIDLSVIS